MFSEPCEHCRGRGVLVHMDPVDEKRRGGNGGGSNGNGNGGGRREQNRQEQNRQEQNRQERADRDRARKDDVAETEETAEAAEVADSLSFAMLSVLEALGPVERAAFLLREVFGYGYDEVAAVLDRYEPACRQIVARARARVEAGRPRRTVARDEHRRVLERLARGTHKPALVIDVDAGQTEWPELTAFRDRVTLGAAARPASATGSGPPVARPSVTSTTSGLRAGSRSRSTRSTSWARSSPAASGVRPPVGRVSSRAAAASTDEVGGRDTSAADPRNVTSPTLSRRW